MTNSGSRNNIILSALILLLRSELSWVKGHNHPPAMISSTSHNASFLPKPRGRAYNQTLSHEHCLMRQLMLNYDRSVRPVDNPHHAVNVTLDLTLKKILDLDEKNQILTTSIWLAASWYDQHLNWASEKFGGIVSILIPPNKIWLPDIVLYNSVDDYTSGYMPSLAMVYNDSRVFWGPVVRFRSACKIDITYFPFDNQICKMKMGSWAYNGLQVDIWNSSKKSDLSTYVDNGEWELLAVKQRRNVVFYSCCKEPFPDVTFTIILRRRTVYYFMNILIPCIILSVLCVGGFLLPSDSGEKITLGLSVLLTITVFMLMVADRMPHTSESISVISIYLMAVLSTSCISVLSSVLILCIHHQSSPTKVPVFLRWICRGICRRMFPFETDKPSDTTTNNNNDDESSTTSHIDDSPVESPILIGSTNEDMRIRQILSKYNREKEHTLIDDEYVCNPRNRDALGCIEYDRQSSINGTINNLGTRQTTGDEEYLKTRQNYPLNSTSLNIQQNNIEKSCDDRPLELNDRRCSLVTQLITMITDKEHAEAKKQEIFEEWHNLAHILDRLLFIFFLTLTIISTACVLQLRPSEPEL